MRIEAFLRQSPIVQTSRIARRMEASLNLMLKDEEVTAFEALVLAALFFEKRGEIKPSALAEAFIIPPKTPSMSSLPSPLPASPSCNPSPIHPR